MADDQEKGIENMPEARSFDEYLEKQAQMETLFKDKFSRCVTVMFTDLKGSTTLAESVGDLSSRLLIKHHNDIVHPSISGHNGILVKTMGDGTLSYFENAQDAVRTAADILKKIDGFNVREKPTVPILIRIGIHTGKCIIEKNDIFGDTVNTASRFETSANPGEVYFSEDTYNALSDKSEVYCRYIKTVALKGKSEPFRAYKAFWNPDEIAADMSAQKSAAEAGPATVKKTMPAALKIAILVLVPLLAILLLSQWGRLTGVSKPDNEKRSINERSSSPAGQAPAK